jgi:hypothetical protein
MISDLCIKHDALCFSDEVYEWLTYKGHQHIKIGRPGARELLCCLQPPVHSALNQGRESQGTPQHDMIHGPRYDSISIQRVCNNQYIVR